MSPVSIFYDYSRIESTRTSAVIGSRFVVQPTLPNAGHAAPAIT
jgi:hypothetical protein